MNKKLTNVLRTNVTLYFICLVLFALAAIPFDVRLAIGEGAAAVLLLIIARRRSRSVQQSMRQYMDRFTGGMDSARSSNMLFAPLPMMVFDADTQAVVWCNDGFLELTEQKEGVFDAHLNAVVPSFSVRWLLEGKNECPENVVWNHRIYRVYGGLTRPTPDTPATMATTYWMDVTDSEQLRQTLQMTRPVVAILMVDNYEDLMKATPEGKRSAVRAMLEEKLSQWSAGSERMMPCASVRRPQASLMAFMTAAFFSRGVTMTTNSSSSCMEMPSFWLMRLEFCRRPLRIVPPMAPALLAASIASLL